MEEFIFTWLVENYSFCWHKVGQQIFSPTFTADKLEGTSWNLSLYPSGMINAENVGCFLHRNDDNGPDTFAVNSELSLLAVDGSLLESRKTENQRAFKKNEGYGFSNFVSRCKVLMQKRDEYLPQETLTVQCRMWKGAGDVSNTTKVFARTRVGAEHISFVGVVEGFRGLLSNEMKDSPIVSGRILSLMTIDVSLTDGSCCEEKVMVEILPLKSKQIKFLSCKLSLLRADGDAIECGQGEACFNENQAHPLKLHLSIPKKVLMERKNEYLPEDTLSLQCDATFSTGIEINKVERIVCGRQWMSKLMPVSEDGNRCKVCANLHGLGGAFGDLRSLYNDQIMSDVKLNAKTESFPAHKILLCARSPVFRAVFTNDIKEKTGDCIEVTDLEDDTVRRFLLFLYTDFAEDLDWDIACKLYYAADKYQVHRLKEVCSSFMMENLNASNVSGLLVLADMHRDADLKHVAEDFILEHDDEVFGSDTWETFSKAHPNLAMVTMLLKYKKKI